VDTNYLNGDELVLQDLAANGYRASIVSLDYPATLEAGATGTVELVLKNEGAREWRDKTHLATTEPRDHDSALAGPSWLAANRVMGLDSPVPSGQTVTLKFDIVAPAEPGPLVEHLNLVEEGVAWFSDLAPGGGPADDAIALTIEVVPASEPTTTTGAGGGGGGGDDGGNGPTLIEDGIPNHRGSRAIASCSAAPGSTALGSAARGSAARSGGGSSPVGMAMLGVALCVWLRTHRRSTKIRAPWPRLPSTRSSGCSGAIRKKNDSPQRSSSAS
ncbi:MAG: hypothetical protein FJ096_18550, partial [Deltaproteobacteria bacterium]|nr:hypothetical protein [Deltaproteobacteria bacterium]